MNLKGPQHSRIYNDFYELHHDSYASVMRFYELNLRAIEHLPLEEQVELLAEYLNACFESAAYHKFINYADELIESVIFHNISQYRGRDLYQDTLFRKAASYYNIGNVQSAMHIARELKKMDPQNPNYRLLFRKCRMSDHSTFVRKIRNTALFLLLFTSLLIAFELLLVPRFFPGYTSSVNVLKIAAFVMAMLLIGVAEIILRVES
jgi:tetratricopeptide (TPR) repeat protein